MRGRGNIKSIVLTSTSCATWVSVFSLLRSLELSFSLIIYLYLKVSYAQTSSSLIVSYVMWCVLRYLFLHRLRKYRYATECTFLFLGSAIVQNLAPRYSQIAMQVEKLCFLRDLIIRGLIACRSKKREI